MYHLHNVMAIKAIISITVTAIKDQNDSLPYLIVERARRFSRRHAIWILANECFVDVGFCETSIRTGVHAW
jgi:hypothetical protein